MRLPRSSIALLLLGLLLVPPSPSRAQLVVSDQTAAWGLFFHGFDGATGDWIGGGDLMINFDSALANGVQYGPDGRMYLVSNYTNTSQGVTAKIKWAEFDGTGFGPVPSGIFVDGLPLNSPTDISWGAYGGQNVAYVGDIYGNVLAYGDSGSHLGTPFTSPENGAIFGLGIEGRFIYASIGLNDSARLYKFDGETGEIIDDPNDGDAHFADLFGQSPSNLQWRPYDVEVHPNGDIYMTAMNNQTIPGGDPILTGGAVFRIRSDTTGKYTDGTVIQSFQDSVGTTLQWPSGIAISDDGMIYVVSAQDFKIQRFTEDLVFDQTFGTLPAGFGATFHRATFIPTDCRDGVDNDGDGDIDLADSGCTDGFDNAETDGTDHCDDGIDNDGDGGIDSADVGCSDGNGLETSPILPCDDGIDNDSDGRTDFDPVTFANPGDETSPPGGSGDPGCGSAVWTTESPQCQNGVNDDGQTGTDYDGAAFLNGGTPIDVVDPNCVDKPWAKREKPGCGASISPIEGPYTPGLAVLMLLFALFKPSPRRRSSRKNS